MKKLDKELATELCHLAGLAYTPKSNINYELTEFEITHLEDKGTDTQGFIAVDDKRVIISFRGTTNWKDWKSNLNTEFMTDRTELALQQHEGFSEAYYSVSEQVNKVISCNMFKEVYVTGHSLGAAIANVCAVELFVEQGVALAGLYTFGSPRVFDEASAAELNRRLKDVHFRFVNNNDVVAHVPPEFSDFSHWGRLMYFREGGMLLEDTELNFWKRIQYAAEGILADVGELGVDGVKDHDQPDYYLYLKATLTPN